MQKSSFDISFLVMINIAVRDLVLTIILALAPISELRGAIPFGIASGLPLWAAYPLCVGLNALVAPLVFLFLNTFHKLFYKWSFYRNLFDKIVTRARTKIHAQVEKYGYLGIMLFVAIPLPITGAYTGTLGAWILGLSKRKTYLAVMGGVVISGIIVSLVVTMGMQAFSFFVKQV